MTIELNEADKYVEITYNNDSIPRKEFRILDKFYHFYRGQAVKVPKEVADYLIQEKGFERVK